MYPEVNLCYTALTEKCASIENHFKQAQAVGMTSHCLRQQSFGGAVVHFYFSITSLIAVTGSSARQQEQASPGSTGMLTFLSQLCLVSGMIQTLSC